MVSADIANVMKTEQIVICNHLVVLIPSRIFVCTYQEIRWCACACIKSRFNLIWIRILVRRSLHCFFYYFFLFFWICWIQKSFANLQWQINTQRNTSSYTLKYIHVHRHWQRLSEKESASKQFEIFATQSMRVYNAYSLYDDYVLYIYLSVGSSTRLPRTFVYNEVGNLTTHSTQNTYSLNASISQRWKYVGRTSKMLRMKLVPSLNDFTHLPIINIACN